MVRTFEHDVLVFSIDATSKVLRSFRQTGNGWWLSCLGREGLLDISLERTSKSAECRLRSSKRNVVREFESKEFEIHMKGLRAG